MVLRVTFDTNVLDWACRPERFPKDPLQPLMYQVNAALRNGGIKGFYSVTMLTIEGIKRCDRAEVFANTRITSESEAAYTIKNADLPDAVRKIVGSGDLETIPLTLRVEQPSRKPLHPEVASRMKAAREMGVRVLGDVPRTGAFHLTDPSGRARDRRSGCWIRTSQSTWRKNGCIEPDDHLVSGSRPSLGYSPRTCGGASLQ